MTRNPLWERFDSVRTKETHGDGKLLLTTFVSLSLPAPYTHRDVVEKILAQSQEPMAIESLADDLSQAKSGRGQSIFGLAGDEIDAIAAEYEDMHWWISKGGLNMAIVPPAAAKLSRFDELAGKLYVDLSSDGKLSKKLLVAIAIELDAAGFTVKQLQPAQWRPISLYNQRNSRKKNSGKAIKTFEQACRHPVCVRSVRRRLYVARERYTKARPPVSPLPSVS